MPRNWSTPRFSRPWTRPDGVSTITPTTLPESLTLGSGHRGHRAGRRLTRPRSDASVAAAPRRVRARGERDPVMVPRQLRRVALVAALVAVCMPAAGGAASPEMRTQPERRTPRLTVLSSDADKATGGDALVEVLVPRGGARHLALSLHGTDVTGAPTEIEPPRFVGVVPGLSEGENLLVASIHGPTAAMLPRSASKVVVNHRRAGPVFSGPHQQPFYCETVAAGLGDALDADCTAPTQVVYRYRTTAGQFAPLADPAARPPDLATVTVGGVEVPYIVRMERGVINRR